MNPNTTLESPYVSKTRQLVTPLVTGLVVGILVYGLTWLIRRFLVGPMFCQTADTAAFCSNGPQIAWYISMILFGLASVFALARAQVYRPLLVVIAALIALSGIGAFILPMTWLVGLLWTGVLFALAYALFAWLASLSNFIISAALIVIVTILLAIFAR